MIALVGQLGVLVAIVSSLELIFQGYRGLREPAAAVNLRRPVLGILGGAAAAMIALEIGILLDDFSIEYVANNSASTTPLIFKIASAWAALEGSIVLWGLVLGGYVYTVYRQVQRRGPADRLGAGALLVLGIVSLFFFGMMVTVSNPFRVCIEAAATGCLEGSNASWAASVAPLQGRGPNPLLQNHILMAVHPPLLYLGYVGMSVPFAFAMSALMAGSGGTEWLKRTRAWTLIAWGFLTLGIVLGGLWSYEVLGWGGYWAWDPVENASFLPWLTATAFIHSSVVQARRGMLQAWNFVLVIATFALTILGTFLTRSGVITSVHSFTQSAVGPVLLWFLMVVLVASFGLFAMRVNLVASSPRLDSLASREGAFLVNNLLLTVFAFVVLVGTLYPIFVEAFTGDQVGVGPPFFNRMAIPISFALLLAMGIGPVTPYRKARTSIVWERIRVPLRLALAAGAVAVLLQHRSPLLLVGVLTASFVCFVILRNLYYSARTIAQKRDMALPAALLRAMRSDPGYWGGQLSHLGVALLALGIVLSSSLAVETEAVLIRGETVNVAGYDITYVDQFFREESHRSVIGADLEVRSGDRLVARQQPRLNQYGNFSQTVATPAVHISLAGDLYFTLQSINSERVALGILWFPYIWLVWVGGFLTGLAVLWSRLVRKPARKEMPEPAVAAGES